MAQARQRRQHQHLLQPAGQRGPRRRRLPGKLLRLGRGVGPSRHAQLQLPQLLQAREVGEGRHGAKGGRRAALLLCPVEALLKQQVRQLRQAAHGVRQGLRPFDCIGH